MSDEADQLLDTLAIRGMLRGEIPAASAELVTEGLAIERKGMLVPTPDGRERAIARLRLPAGGEAETALRPLYERFLPLNRSIREICVDWQTKPDGTANDHSDAAYDAGVRDRLEDVNERAIPLLRRMSEVEASLGAYIDGLETSLAAIDAGDPSMLTAPLSASYHTVWMWWHQELLLRLGIDRSEDEQLEEKLVSEQGA